MSSISSTQTGRSIRQRWVTWSVCTALMAIYAIPAWIESTSTSIELGLRSGNERAIEVWRVFDDTLLAYLRVDSPCGGGPTRLEVRANGREPVVLEAVPHGRDCVSTFRALEAGERIPLKSGRNDLRIRVLDVDAQTLGRNAYFVVQAPLGITGDSGDRAFLNYGFFLGPVFLVSQPIWLALLLMDTWIDHVRRRRRPK